MRKIYLPVKITFCVALLLAIAATGHAQFTAGNLAFIQADASANNTTCSVIEINKTTAGQSAVSTVAISGTGANAFRISGSATSTAYLSHTSDGTLLSFNGANSTNTASNVNALNPRAVATLNAAQTFSLATTYTGGSGDQTRGSTSLNNTNWFIADQGGIFTNGGTSASPTGNFRSIKPFGGTVYLFTASTANPSVGTVATPSGSTLVALPGLPNGVTSNQDFYMVSSGSNGSSFDVLYILAATSNTAGTITKYSLVSGSWTSNGSHTTNFGGFGLAAEKNGTGANLYVTTGQGALTNNSVIKLNDVNGYNTAISITTANNVNLYTATGSRIIKGIDFVPVAPALPTVSLSVSPSEGNETAATVITVTATASSAVSGAQTVNLAVTGANITAGDYNLSNTTITIPNGQTTGSVTFTVVDDAVVESLETATLTISSPSSGITLGSPVSRNVTIEDNDAAAPITVNLSVSSNTGSEAAASVITVTATASAPVSGNQTVTLGVSGTGITAYDYNLSGTTITILNGQTTGTVTFTIRSDAETEGAETATLTISSPSAGITLGATTTQNITIADNTCLPLIRKSTATSTNGAEISAFDPSTNQVFTVAGPAMEYYSLSNAGVLSGPNNMPFGFTPPGGTNALPNSVAVRNGVVAVGYAIVNTSSNAQQPGVVAFYQSSTATYISHVTVGYLPDMIAFSPDGSKILTANEGEPNSYGQGNSFDPEGSVSIIDISGGVASATVQTAGFTSFNSQMASLKAAGVRIFGPGATVAQDLEPEYVAFSADGTKAFVTLQENNAVAELDMATATITQIIPLGLKDHSLAGNGFDASDRDLSASAGRINIQNWPVYGMYMPDAISSFTIGGNTYYITANEGDSRAYTGFSEEVRVGAGAYVLDPTVFPNAATLKLNENLGRLQLTNASGDTDGDGDFDQIHAFGARSFTIWNGSFGRVYDSGDQLEQISAAQSPATFNSEGAVATFDTRSDNKGPEPEAVTTGMVNGRLYAFVGSERTGDIYVFDITNPNTPVFKQYIDHPADLGVEGLAFVPESQSPTGKALLIATAEVSMTVSIYEVNPVPQSLPTVNTALAGVQSASTAYGNCEGLIATVQQQGASPVSGNVDAKVWIEGSVPVNGGIPFVQRHYELTPTTGAATATGRVTLYFTQTEFDNFNGHPASSLDLPTGSGDAAGIANLRVIKYPGTSNDGSGLPASYTGTPVPIDPVDADIIWNATANRWEVSFDVTGFSGFIVQTNLAILPVTVVGFNAIPQNSHALVSWKSLAEQQQAYYEVEYSLNGTQFNTVSRLNAQNGNTDRTYGFTHTNAATLAAKLYYRLKMVTVNGNIQYSVVVPVRFSGNGQAVTDVYPNPVKDRVYIVTTASAAQPLQIRIVDMSGKLLTSQRITAAGNHSIDLSAYAPGMYLLEAVNQNGAQQYKIVKE